MEDFEEREMMRFSWPGFFAVSGISCFIFSMFLKVIEEENTPWLLIAGASSMVLAFFCYLSKKQKLNKKKMRRRSAIFNED